MSKLQWTARQCETAEISAGMKVWFSGFRFDITDVANYGGRNVIAVKVDASKFEGWFYEGAGIYRHVWLEKSTPVAIAPDGIFVYSQFKGNIPEGAAAIHIQTQLLNAETNSADATVQTEIISPTGETLAQVRQSATVPGAGTKDFEQATSKLFSDQFFGRWIRQFFTRPSPRWN